VIGVCCIVFTKLFLTEFSVFQIILVIRLDLEPDHGKGVQQDIRACVFIL
jgi:hypothetical protein